MLHFWFPDSLVLPTKGTVNWTLLVAIYHNLPVCFISKSIDRERPYFLTWTRNSYKFTNTVNITYTRSDVKGRAWKMRAFKLVKLFLSYSCRVYLINIRFIYKYIHPSIRTLPHESLYLLMETARESVP